jgi:hypothetical protein
VALEIVYNLFLISYPLPPPGGAYLSPFFFSQILERGRLSERKQRRTGMGREEEKIRNK